MNYSSGDFIYHKDLGVGQVESVMPRQLPKGEKINNSEAVSDVVVVFEKGLSKTFTDYLLDRSVSGVSPNGFRALAYTDLEAAQRLLQDDPVEAICLVLEDFPGYRAKTDDFKDHLGPFIPVWDKWWEITQPLLKSSPRIDSTNSKLREYGIHQELHSPAEEHYLAFKHFKSSRRPTSVIYDRAKGTLIEFGKGAALLDEHLQELLAYMRYVTASDQEALSLRLDALFRLEEGKWATSDDVQDQIEKLLRPNIKLYELELFPLNRLADFLIKRAQPLNETELAILSSGICASDLVIKSIVQWAFLKTDPNIISRVLIEALTNNLPPDLEEEKYLTLQKRLEASVKLVKSLPLSHPSWPIVIQGFTWMVKSIALKDQFDNIRFLLPSIIVLAAELHKQVSVTLPDLGLEVLNGLVQSSFTVQFILALIDTSGKVNEAKDFAPKLEDRFLRTIAQRRDDPLRAFIAEESDWSQRVEQLNYIIEKYDSEYLKDRAGKLISEIAGPRKDDELVQIIPNLDRFYHLDGNWSWKQTLEGIRERAYLAMFQQKAADGYHDRSITNAAHQLAESGLSVTLQELASHKEDLIQARDQITKLEGILNEKDMVLRELRNGFGGDTSKARFEERSRILKDLVHSIAEFERFAAGQQMQSQGLDAILRRLSSLLNGFNVLPMEDIGTRVLFDPQKHRLVDSENISIGEQVVIMERGYLIYDQKNKLRLLKPAIVKNS